MDVKAAIQPVLDSPRAKALLAQVTTEESKQTIIADLYDMLPRPVRWVLTAAVFEDYVRRHVFREAPKEPSTEQPIE
jgi:uncharacterized membrane-anchored protein YjiN (DUF445 family)